MVYTAILASLVCGFAYALTIRVSFDIDVLRDAMSCTASSTMAASRMCSPYASSTRISTRTIFA